MRLMMYGDHIEILLTTIYKPTSLGIFPVAKLWENPEGDTSPSHNPIESVNSQELFNSHWSKQLP